MKLIVGLGNPGPRYERTRHNLGFMALDAIARRHGFGPFRARFQGLIAEGVVAGERCLALKPMTFMNDSGRSVGEAARFYKLPPADVVVLYDELDLKPGKVKVKTGGGAGGHNGIRSVDSHLGTEYRRVRLGIGHPGDKDRVLGYVLQDVPKAEQPMMDTLVEAVADAFPLLLAGDENGFMNRVTVAVFPPKPKPPRPPAPGGATAPVPSEDPRRSD